MNNQFIKEKNEVLNRIKDIEDIENNNVKKFPKLNQLQTKYEKLLERIKKAKGKKASKALISETKKIEEIKKEIEVEKKGLLEKKHQLILSDLNEVLSSILREDTSKMELQEISTKIGDIINYLDNNNGKNTEIDISWLEDVRNYLKKSENRTNYNKPQNAASIENEEHLNSLNTSEERYNFEQIKNLSSNQVRCMILQGMPNILNDLESMKKLVDL